MMKLAKSSKNDWRSSCLLNTNTVAHLPANLFYWNCNAVNGGRATLLGHASDKWSQSAPDHKHENIY